MQYIVWNGGCTPTKKDKKNPVFKAIRSNIFRELLKNCGGLDYWKCAGTSSMERSRIFWNEANLNAWATIRENN